MFASAAEDVRAWSSTSLDLCWQFDVGSSSKLSSVSWSTDEKQLLSVVRGCDTVQVTEFTGGQPRHTQSHVGVVCSCGQLSPCDECACLGACDGTVLLWDTQNSTAIQSYKPHNKTVTCVAFANDGSLAVSASCDGSVAVRGLDSNGTQSICEPTGKAVTALESSPHNAFRFVFATVEGCIFVWDGSASHPLQKHQLRSRQGISDLSVSPVHEALVASVGLDGRLVLFDTATPSEQASVRAPEGLESVSFLTDGQRLVVGGTSGQLYLYDLRCARRQLPVTLEHPHATPVTAISTAHLVPAEAQMAMSASAVSANCASWAMPPPLDLPVRFSLNSGCH
ncbi:protein NEDD1-like [Haemaphysalis longicornis]